MYDFTWSLVRLAAASLLTGATLSYLRIGPDELLATAGLTRDEAAALLQSGVEWAVPNMLLGLAVLGPIWLVVYLLRPPRAEQD